MATLEREWQVTTEPTCSEKGTETEICNLCGEATGNTRPIEATGNHVYEDVIEEETCTTDAVLYSRCKNCHALNPDKAPEVIPGTKLGHNFVDGVCTECKKKKAEAETLFQIYEEDDKKKIRFTADVEVVDLETYEPVEMGVLYITSGSYQGDGSDLTYENFG